MPVRKKEKEMKIHLKKVLVSLLVIVGFVFYAVYQRYFIAQQAIVNNAPPDTAANGNTSETVYDHNRKPGRNCALCRYD